MSKTTAAVLAPLATLLLLGGLLAWFIGGETPTGTVRGTVVLKENNQPLGGAEVYLTPTETSSDTASNGGGDAPTETRIRRSATTRDDGTFEIARVPVGAYKLSAISEHHKAADGAASVHEGETAHTRLACDRTSPTLELGTFQHVWATRETPKIPVRGYVDAARDLRGDTLHLRVWKTRLSTLLRDPSASKALDALTNGGGYGEKPIAALPQSLLSPATLPASDKPTLVSESDVVIRSGDREGYFTERLPLPATAAKGPGLYLVEVRHGKNAAVSGTVLSTDMALVVKRARGQVTAWAVGLNSGSPVAGAAVTHWRDGAKVGGGVTNNSGLATLAVPDPPRKNSDDGGDAESSGHDVRLLTVASHGADEAVLGNNAWLTAEDAGGFAVHAYTDRTVYRPGHTVKYKVIVRRHADPADPGSYAVPAGEPVTVEVRDPTGSRVVKESHATNRWGTLDGSFDLSSEAPTGAYNLLCTLRGGEKHTADVMVASYRKPDFAVTVTPSGKSAVQGDTLTATVEGRYYFGSPVAGAKVVYHVFRTPDWSRLYADESEGSSDDPDDAPPPGYDGGGGEHYYGETAVEGEAVLDENGRALVTIPTERKRRAQGKTKGQEAEDANAAATALDLDYTYTISATVTDEQTHRAVDSDATVAVTAGSFTLGLAPEGYAAAPSVPHSLIVRARAADGKPVPNIDVTVVPSFERWDAKTKAYTTSDLSHIKAKTGPDGSAIVSVTPPHAGSVRLRATAYDDKGRVLHARSELWVTDDRGSDLDTDYADLALLTDKRHYEPGDTARVLVNCARTGQSVFLTVEGDTVLSSRLVPITHRSTVVKLPVLAGWGPNVSLSACYVRDKKFASSDHPLRVRLTGKMLHVAVTPDHQKYRPGKTAAYTVKVTDAQSRPVRAELSLSVVDEAIFALRADDPNALRDAFYPHRDSRVVTDYSFDVRYLGDADKSEPKITVRRKFLDTAFWSPHVETDGTGTAHVSLPLPDNLTTWRTTVLACDAATHIGRGVAKVVVSQPFFVRLDAPRFVTQNDQGQLLALVHNETDAGQTVHVRLHAPGLLSTDLTQTLTVAAGQIGTVPIPLTVPAALVSGDVPLTLSAYTDAKDEATGQPFSDGVAQTLPVRAYAREMRTDFGGEIVGETAPFPSPAAGEGGRTRPSQQPRYSPLTPEDPRFRPPSPAAGEGKGEGAALVRTFPLTPATILPETRLTVRVTPSIRAALAPALEYVVGYPYGCTEQTLSRFFPSLLVARAQKETGQTLLTGPKATRLPVYVRDGITRLRRFQHGASGAWGWWEHDPDSAFLTAYALYGLSEARRDGYDVPTEMTDSAQKAARTLLADVKNTSPTDRAFLVYALAEAGDRDTVTAALRTIYTVPLNKKHPETTRLSLSSSDALAYLVLAAHRVGADPTPAFHQLERKQIREGRLLHWSGSPDSGNSSDRMATALALRALLATDPRDSRIPAVLRYLMAARTDDYWESTRDTTWVLAALTDYLRTHPEDAAPASGTLVVRVNDREIQRIDLAANASEHELSVRVPSSALKVGQNTFSLSRDGGGTGGNLFWSGTLREMVGVPSGGGLPAFGPKGITVKREYLRVESAKVGLDGYHLLTTLIDNHRFAQGDSVRVRLTITTPRDVPYVLIEDRFPSNLEVTERGTAEAVVEDEGWSYWYSNVDVRDDRIAFFAATLPAGTHTVEYNLRAQSPGVARALPAQMQAMYDPTVRAESSDTRVEVGK